MIEAWKMVENYPDYSVSNFGNVFNHILDKFMKPHTRDDGYWTLTLSRFKKQKGFYLHRLVANAFCFQPENCVEVNHIDGDKSNNISRNLEWVTSSENHYHAFKMGLMTPNRQRPVLVIDTNEAYPSLRACGRAIGGSREGIFYALQSPTRSYLGHKFQYLD